MKRVVAFQAAAAPVSQAPVTQAGASRKVVLIASTTWWAYPARIAQACARRGMVVDAICGPGHPLQKTAAARTIFAYSALQPLRALERAITRSEACLVLPCDDRALAHLHLLHARGSAAVRRVIETSLGDANQFPILEDRAALIEVASSLGIAAPQTLRVPDASALDAAVAQLGLPAVLKVDGTWGGFGVAVVRTQHQARAAFARLSKPLSFGRMVKRLLVDRDAFHVRAWMTREKPRVSLQRFVPGRPANSISACLDGEILGTVCAESLLLQGPNRASSVVRIIENQEMREAAEKLARHLRMSGVFGLDFLLDERTGQTQLVEMNARATPLTHLAFGAGRDLIGGIGHIAGMPTLAEPVRVTGRDVIAYFPQAMHTAPGNPWLTAGYHDVPWDDPGLTEELMKLPRPDRGLLATALRRLRGQPAGAGIPAACVTMDVT